ncbi:MAG: hypothetical protein JNN16_13175 [Nitrospira sp.]|nr:hypothetical protein [Nitrospira sp.]
MTPPGRVTGWTTDIPDASVAVSTTFPLLADTLTDTTEFRLMALTRAKDSWL